ncbi:MAG: hypothetical protein ACRCXZ_10105 [Patescibacteria group bacterium]
MESWEEVQFLISILKNCTEVEIVSTDPPERSQSMRIKSRIAFSSYFNQFVMIVEKDGENVDFKNINQTSKFGLKTVHSAILELIYPVSIDRLSPLNLIDSNCRAICSIVIFSSSFQNSNIFVNLTHTDGCLEISYQDLLKVLQFSGAKVQQYSY